MAIIILLVLVLLFCLPDLYISLTLMKGVAWWAHLLLWLPAITAIALMASTPITGFSRTKIYLVIGILLCLTMPQIIFTVISLLGKLTGLVWSPAATIGLGLGIAVGAIATMMTTYGMLFGWKRLAVKEVELSFADLPKEFDGYTIVHLADLHIGTHGDNKTFVEKVVRRTNEAKPDLIVFTGDLVNTQAKETEPFEPLLSQLQAPDGVMSVLGNHDYCFYGSRERPADPHQEADKVVEAERRMGWEVLLNTHRMIRRGEAQIAVAGVEDIGKPPFEGMGDLKAALAGIPDSTFTILLSHDPSHWRMEVTPETDIPLTLSGHTHAAQLKLGRWSPARWLYPEWGGLYEEGSQRLYVSEGLGGSVPIRIGTKPEIVVFRLRHSEN